MQIYPSDFNNKVINLKGLKFPHNGNMHTYTLCPKYLHRRWGNNAWKMSILVQVRYWKIKISTNLKLLFKKIIQHNLYLIHPFVALKYVQYIEYVDLMVYAY